VTALELEAEGLRLAGEEARTRLERVAETNETMRDSIR
jgi:hypothetical protein